MTFWENVLQLLNTQMDKPVPYGAFHLVCCGLSLAASLFLCRIGKRATDRGVCRLVLGVAVVVAILEVYKQINFSFTVGDAGIVFDYQWYSFPWQFCSQPLYVGLLAGLTRKGWLHDAACAFLATYAIFAGICVMLYPVTVFIETAGINVQTMVCHGSMLPVGAYLYASGHVKAEFKTFLKALPVFLVAVVIAMVMNEVAFQTGLLETEEFNMFFISPYCEPSLPVYSMVQQVVPFPWCVIIYIAAFSLAAYLVLLAAIGIRKLALKKPLSTEDRACS